MSLGNYTNSVAPSSAPIYPTFYTRVSSGVPAGSGARTTLHAVIDYDDDDYAADGGGPSSYSSVSSSYQGPIVIKNDKVAVVPLYSYGHTVSNNGTLLHIPVLWSALSIALGLEIRGDVIRGTPCIKRHHQLFCPSAGNKYPLENIELFIDENKALMRRMYGEFETSPEYGPPGAEMYESDRIKRKSGSSAKGSREGAGPYHPDGDEDTRIRRQAFPGNTTADNGKLDACQSKVEIVTPYWAANSAGKIRAIVNTQHFEQAIHQEVCSKTQTNRCNGDCGCEQKYKWHRLLAYDPDNDCKGIFMDWFLFPSCCVCRCSPENVRGSSTSSSNFHNSQSMSSTGNQRQRS